jgi:hypothetical protein
MELSLFLAQLFGMSLIIISALVLYRPMLLEETIRDLKPYSFTSLMAGFIGIVCGLAIILSHNIWEFSYRGVVTLFGWSALLKGISYVAFPQLIIKSAKKILKGKRSKVTMLVALLTGCYLTYYGFDLSA